MKKPEPRNKKGELKAPLHILYKEFKEWQNSIQYQHVLVLEELNSVQEKSNIVHRWIEYKVFDIEVDLFEVRCKSPMGGGYVFDSNKVAFPPDGMKWQRLKDELNKPLFDI